MRPKAMLAVLMTVGCCSFAACRYDAPAPTTVPPTTVHQHSYTETVTDATCTEIGYTTYSCTCGDIYSDEEIAALGHSYEEQYVGPTTVDRGYTLHTCTQCGDSYQDDFIDPLTEEAPAEEGSFFDDAAFIGDSVLMKLEHYQRDYGVLGDAAFMTMGNYSVNHAVNSTMLLNLDGQSVTPEDGLAACGVQKVFIMLGMNDIALWGIDQTIRDWGILVERIREKNPGIAIYILSGTPIYSGGLKGGLNNEKMDAYNQRLTEFAQTNDCGFIDVATPLKDSTNGLALEYCSDRFVHMTYAACEVWVDVLQEYVTEQEKDSDI